MRKFWLPLYSNKSKQSWPGKIKCAMFDGMGGCWWTVDTDGNGWIRMEMDGHGALFHDVPSTSSDFFQTFLDDF